MIRQQQALLSSDAPINPPPPGNVVFFLPGPSGGGFHGPAMQPVYMAQGGQGYVVMGQPAVVVPPQGTNRPAPAPLARPPAPSEGKV